MLRPPSGGAGGWVLTALEQHQDRKACREIQGQTWWRARGGCSSSCPLPRQGEALPPTALLSFLPVRLCSLHLPPRPFLLQQEAGPCAVGSSGSLSPTAWKSTVPPDPAQRPASATLTPILASAELGMVASPGAQLSKQGLFPRLHTSFLYPTPLPHTPKQIS